MVRRRSVSRVSKQRLSSVSKNVSNSSSSESIPFLSNQERLSIYKILTGGCSHLWSKNKIQIDKVLGVLSDFIRLANEDPIFLAHLTSWVIDKSDSKDLKVVSTYTNFLNSGDGTPFSVGSKYKKPDLRIVSEAAVQKLDPKLVDRVHQLSRLKFSVKDILREARHCPSRLITSLQKYMRFREKNISVLNGIVKAGLKETFKTLYRKLSIAPSTEAASILRWKQKDGRKIEIKKSQFDFTGLSLKAIAKKIVDERLPVLSVIGALPKITPAIAVALLEQSTPDQAIILKTTFEDSGVLSDSEVLKLYEKKISNAKTAIDRVETIAKTASDEVQKIMKQAKSVARKSQVGDIGKIFLHLDISKSMDSVLEFAKDKGSIIAECVSDPEKNFRWGAFSDRGMKLSLPFSFEKDAFAQVLFGIRCDGQTDCFANYPAAREFGAEVDVFASDQGHNVGNLEEKIRRFHRENSKMEKPKACVIINFGGDDCIERAYKGNDIPVTIIDPDVLESSAMISQSVKSAISGPVAIIEEIMDYPLLKLPNWYYVV